MKGSTDHLAEARAKMGPKLLELSKEARKKKKESKIVSCATEDLPTGLDLPKGISRLAGHGYPLDATKMRRLLKKAGITNEQFIEWSGFTLKQWVEAHPRWSERSFEVLVIENLEHIKWENWNEAKV